MGAETDNLAEQNIIIQENRGRARGAENGRILFTMLTTDDGRSRWGGGKIIIPEFNFQSRWTGALCQQQATESGWLLCCRNTLMWLAVPGIKWQQKSIKMGDFETTSDTREGALLNYLQGDLWSILTRQFFHFKEDNNLERETVEEKWWPVSRQIWNSVLRALPTVHPVPLWIFKIIVHPTTTVREGKVELGAQTNWLTSWLAGCLLHFITIIPHSLPVLLKCIRCCKANWNLMI